MKHKIVECLRSGNFKYTVHALQRMNERTIIAEDIINIGLTCNEDKIYQQEHGTWIVKGKSLEHYNLEVSCDYEEEDDLLIVTVYYSDKKIE